MGQEKERELRFCCEIEIRGSGVSCSITLVGEIEVRIIFVMMVVWRSSTPNMYQLYLQEREREREREIKEASNDPSFPLSVLHTAYKECVSESGMRK